MTANRGDWLTWAGRPEQARRGCSLGNADSFLRADAEANLDGLWLAANNRWYAGELALRVSDPEWTLLRVVYAPAYQSAVYTDAAGAEWEKRIFLAASEADVYLWLHGQGIALAEGAAAVEIVCDWRVGAARSETHRAQPWQDCEREWQIESESPDGLCVRPRDAEPDRQRLWSSHPAQVRRWTEPARVRQTFSVPVSPEGTVEFRLCLRVRAGASDDLESAPPVPSVALKEAEQALGELIGPEPASSSADRLVERAVGWGMVSSRRVWHRYSTGDWGFTNDPPGNTIVTRDAAWFGFGADHFAPHWTRTLLETLARHAPYPNGKIAEYVRLSPESVRRDDYGLNINDATPLFVLAVVHHWQTTRDRTELESLYPAARGAAAWIVAQRRDDGLVWCDGRGTNVHGIGGWRNIIPGYRLAGALTELNAECVAALRAAAVLAEAVNDPDSQRQFADAAGQLDAAMAQLVDPQTGLFLLTRYADRLDRQIAVDLALPALFEAGPEEARLRTLFRLVESDFHSPSGLRCLSRDDPAYHPRFGWGLMGGSWPNATTWVAAALAPYRPELAWELAAGIARALFPEHWIAPGVSVPGEFPEWFDGETGESAGMSLSPWMPATYVWLVRERLAGTSRPA